MVQQNLRYWMNFVRSNEVDFQKKVKATLQKLWGQDPQRVESNYSNNSFSQLVWYRNLPIWPPDNFTLEEFKRAWPADGWGESKIQDCRILAQLLQIKDREGRDKPINLVAKSLLEVDISKHEGRLTHERKFILWTIHRERVRQAIRDNATLQILYQRDVA